MDEKEHAELCEQVNNCLDESRTLRNSPELRKELERIRSELDSLKEDALARKLNIKVTLVQIVVNTICKQYGLTRIDYTDLKLRQSIETDFNMTRDAFEKMMAGCKDGKLRCDRWISYADATHAIITPSEGRDDQVRRFLFWDTVFCIIYEDYYKQDSIDRYKEMCEHSNFDEDFESAVVN